MTQQNFILCLQCKPKKENCFWELHLILHNMSLLKINYLSVLLMYILLE